MWTSVHPHEQKSFGFMMSEETGWNDLSTKRQEAINALVEKYPDIHQTAFYDGDTSDASSKYSLMQRHSIPDDQSDVVEDRAWSAYNKTQNLWKAAVEPPESPRISQGPTPRAGRYAPSVSSPVYGPAYATSPEPRRPPDSFTSPPNRISVTSALQIASDPFTSPSNRIPATSAPWTPSRPDRLSASIKISSFANLALNILYGLLTMPPRPVTKILKRTPRMTEISWDKYVHRQGFINMTIDWRYGRPYEPEDPTDKIQISNALLEGALGRLLHDVSQGMRLIHGICGETDSENGFIDSLIRRGIRSSTRLGRMRSLAMPHSTEQATYPRELHLEIDQR
ncbi:hypothetical protein FSARC_12536 [Fusarium sarcochroum]|uniref:Uncharacterized protein n=1 Tax=Fusarium sarcochroum TaxID=1208366 RepID=A0A8H4T7R3_9HYPO|nr:hypothetical protein FSARC_12536 [Fusarium sarcochroum]